MSLPHGFLDELRSRTSLSQVVGRKVMWDQRKSNQGKGDMWAPCPFHHEKTASFHVDDQKGFYYCFGCHAKGDAISFVRETENVGFMEAVEIIAAEAGMPIPKQDPKAQEKADYRTQLAEVMEQAVQYFRLQLKTGGAASARDYLAGRGLDEAAQDRWDIGFAPDARQGVFAYLTGKGVAPELIIDAGLAARPDDGRDPYDRFRGRIIFPIRDVRGRAIALGGRAMDPNARAKYLNSPETPLFDKGRTLYNQKNARTAAGKGQTLIVAEGYMDVIALVEAGFDACVAPLGTAITENQLQMMWRIAPEPVIALDGDKAGLNAAMRLIDLALPLLEAGQSLRFALMPEGLDPDDVLKQQGKGAMRKLLDGSMPMVDLLWQRETEGGVFDSPERKAALDKKLRAAISTIRDPSIQMYYDRAIRNLTWNLNKAKTKSNGKFDSRNLNKGASYLPSPSAKASFLAHDGAEQITNNIREAAILAIIITCSKAAINLIGALENTVFFGPFHNEIKQAFLMNESKCQEVPGRMKRIIKDRIGVEPLEQIFGYSHVKLILEILEPDNPTSSAKTLEQELAKLNAQRGLSEEIQEAAADLIDGIESEKITWRLKQATDAYNKAVRSETDDTAVFETAENGMQIDKGEKDAFSQLVARVGRKKRP